MITFSDRYIDIGHQSAGQQIIARLADGGLFTFSTTEGACREDLLRIADMLGDVHDHTHADDDGVTAVAPREAGQDKPGLLGFSRAMLGLHTDGSGQSRPPDLIVNVCQKAANSGGETLLVDMKAVYKALKRSYPGVADDLERPGSAIFGIGQNLYSGAIFEQASDRVVCRFRADGAGFMDIRLASSLQILTELLERSCIRLPLQDGQGYVINNGQWLHGRSAFSGERLFLRVLVRGREQAIRCGFPSD